jgi:hypothetical protein
VKQLACYCVPLFDGAGLIGCGADEPEPAVLGGVAVRAGMLAVVDVEGPLLAVLLLLFQPAMIRKPISSGTATPAIQPHMPPTLSSRRTTGSLNRRSVKNVDQSWYPPWFGTLCVVSNEGNPLAITAAANLDSVLQKPEVSGGANCEPPGSPVNKEKTGEEHRQTRGRRPMFDCSTNKVGDSVADQDENDIKRNQFHGSYASINSPCGLA